MNEDQIREALKQAVEMGTALGEQLVGETQLYGFTSLATCSLIAVALATITVLLIRAAIRADDNGADGGIFAAAGAVFSGIFSIAVGMWALELLKPAFAPTLYLLEQVL